MPDGAPVERITLRGEDGFEAQIITLGAVLQTLVAPDRDGGPADVVLGHDELAGYMARRDFFGATVGRFANRIAGAAFTLDGERFTIMANETPNALHGGEQGFDRHVWTVAEAGEGPEPFVRLARVSPDGEEGFPGALAVSVEYRLTGPTELTIAFTAETDKSTVVNLTNHSYFNLGGASSGRDVLDHILTVAADAYLPIDAGLLPLGAPRPVEATPFDFRAPQALGTRIRETDEQLLRGQGYDHAFILRGGNASGPRFAARLDDPTSGRRLELFTDQPALQIYSGNQLDGRAHGKGGLAYRQSDAICLEPEAYPDAPNRLDFPSARLDPGEIYRRTIVYRFSVI